MTSYLYHVTQIKPKNKQAIETKDTCFCKENFIDRSFLVFKSLSEVLCDPSPPWLHKRKMSIVNRVNYFYK